MDLQTYDQATELLNKYRLCETILEYLSDPDAVTGQKYKEQCGEFFKVFHDEMLVFTHELMTKCGEEFESLHCPEHSEQPSTPVPPTKPEKPIFPINSKVEILGGNYKGDIGTIIDFDPVLSKYYVTSPQFSMWFPESDLKAYAEESEEQPETPEEDGGTTAPDEGE